MNNILNELKNAFNRPNNSLYQIILINIIIFVLLAILKVFASFGILPGVFEFIHRQFSLPAGFDQFIYRPWTLITYSFSHDLRDIFHIAINMYVLYLFGRLIKEYLGSDKLIAIYVLGALAGGILYLLAFNFVPFYLERQITETGIPIYYTLVGASASVFAISVAAATLLPEHRFHLIFIGPVKIVWIVAFFIFISFLGLDQGNAGGDLAHLGGAFIGFIYIRRIQKGSDIGYFVIAFINFIKSFFVRQSKIKVSYRSKGKKKAEKRSGSTKSPSSSASQAEIDAILDKINASGYESLSKEEKQKLFNAGGK